MAETWLGGAALGGRGRYEAGLDHAWELVTTPPAPSLGAYVERYVGYLERSPEPLRRLETPGIQAKLIFQFGAALEITAPGCPTQNLSQSFFVRFSALPAVTEFSGVSSGIEVALTPLGASMLLGRPMDEVPEPVADLGVLIGRQAELLTERLAESRCWDRRFDLIDRFLESRLRRATEPPPMLDWIWGTLLASGGNAPVGQLADQIGCSPAYLSRSFRRYVGLSPKTAAAVLRFSRADDLLSRQAGRSSLADLAIACGYHDQSHMTRDFRRFTGTTPAAYAANLRSDFLGVPGA